MFSSSMHASSRQRTTHRQASYVLRAGTGRGALPLTEVVLLCQSLGQLSLGFLQQTLLLLVQGGLVVLAAVNTLKRVPTCSDQAGYGNIPLYQQAGSLL